MLRYYKLFDLLFRKNMKLSDLRNVLSSATVSKLRKGEYISGEALDKLCEFLNCQPSDIVEHYRPVGLPDKDNYQRIMAVKTVKEINRYGEELPCAIYVKSLDEPLNENGIPKNGWYEKELIEDYNNLDPQTKMKIDYENARLNKEIYDKINEYIQIVPPIPSL